MPTAREFAVTMCAKTLALLAPPNGLNNVVVVLVFLQELPLTLLVFSVVPVPKIRNATLQPRLEAAKSPTSVLRTHLSLGSALLYHNGKIRWVI